MYSVTVRDHMLVAHTLKGESFGKAQKLHGATYIVDTQFSSPGLNESQVVIDMGEASEIVKEVISHLDYQNLDELDMFRSQNTTSEFLAAYIHEGIASRVRSFFQGKLKVVLRESHVAWASYEGEIG